MAVLADGIAREVSTTSAQPRGRRALGIAVLLAVIATMVWVALDRRATTNQLKARLEAQVRVLDVAGAKVTQLTTFRAETADKDVARLMDDVTDRFRVQFAQQATSFQDAVARQRLSSTGRVDSAAVKSLGQGSAQVLVAASASTTKAGLAGTGRRFYRLLVTLKEVRGAWRLDGLEFV